MEELHTDFVSTKGRGAVLVHYGPGGDCGIPNPASPGTGIPVPRGHTRVYRAVEEAEYQQIIRTGRFEIGPNSVEWKNFADSIEGARAHGEALHGRGRFRIIEADVPDDAPSLLRWPNLDGKGSARFLHIDDLRDIEPRSVEGDLS